MDPIGQGHAEALRVGLFWGGHPQILCSICYSDINRYIAIGNGLFAKTMCSHTSHVNHLCAWCSESMKCPYCRHCIASYRISDWNWGKWEPTISGTASHEFTGYIGCNLEELIWGHERPLSKIRRFDVIGSGLRGFNLLLPWAGTC